MQGGGGWGLGIASQQVAAPPDVCGAVPLFYPYALLFELGTDNEQPVDEVAFPPLAFEAEPGRQLEFDLELWAGFRVSGFIDGNREVNTPVDTATW
jgi:hypothetical protein